MRKASDDSSFNLTVQKQWLQQFNVSDLSRSLIREYLYQNGMAATLECFESQDRENQKKINRSVLVKMLCITNLVIANRQAGKEFKSVLEVLVKYLRESFGQRLTERANFEETGKCQQKSQNSKFSLNNDLNKDAPLHKKKGVNEIKGEISKNRVKTNNGREDFEEFQQAKKRKTHADEKNSKRTAGNGQMLNKNQTVAVKSKEQRVEHFQNNSSRSRVISKNESRSSISEKISQRSIYNKVKNVGNENKGYNDKKPEAKQKGAFPQKLQSNFVQADKGSDNNITTVKNREQKQAQINQKTGITSSHIQVNDYDEDDFENDFENNENNENENTQGQNTYNEQKEEKEKVIGKKSQINQKPHQLHQTLKIANETPNKKTNGVSENEISIQHEISKQENIKQQQSDKIENVRTIQKRQEQSDIENKVTDSAIIEAPRPMRNMLRRPIKQSQKLKVSEDQNGQDSQSKSNVSKSDVKTPLNQDTSSHPQQPTETQSKDKPSGIILEGNEGNTGKRLILMKKPSKTNKNFQSQSILTKSSTQNNQVKPKFKFDQNFVDEPLHKQHQKYVYSPFSLDSRFVIKPELKQPKDSAHIILETTIDYFKRPTCQNVSKTKKSGSSFIYPIQRALSKQKAQQLRTITFQQSSPFLAKPWHQGFILSPFQETPFGLKQLEGGPCGIIAAVQCYFLKHMLYLSQMKEADMKNEVCRQICLVASLADMLWKVKPADKGNVTLIVPMNKRFSESKLEFSCLMEVELQASTFQLLYEGLYSYKSSFIGQKNHGVTLMVYSIIMTKTPALIYQQMDSSSQSSPLIGNHGHCTQQLVNLFITGRSSSNCFDGTKQLQGDFTLQGIPHKSEFGFMTVFETLEYIQVGKNLKNPLFPVWIICKQFHYHVTFGNHYLIAENNDCERFDLVYYDGLYAADKFIRLTFDAVEKDQFGMVKETANDVSKLPLIEQVLLKKWGRRKTDWNGSLKIL